MNTYIIKNNNKPIEKVKGKKNVLGRISEIIARDTKKEWFVWSKNGAKSDKNNYTYKRAI